MDKITKFISLLVCLLIPTKYSFWILNYLGHSVNRKARISFSFIWCKKIILEDSARIGHFNLVLNGGDVAIEEGGYIGNMNIFKGPFSVVLKKKGAIGNRNMILRAKKGVSYGDALVQVGILSKITAEHRLDCTRSIYIGDCTVIAGLSSQFWTHGYVHEDKGTRFRVDGEIHIGDNVYIGSRCVFNPGVEVASGVTVGSNSSVSKSLYEPGLYVSQPLRRVDYNTEDIKSKLTLVQEETVEIVFEKKASK